MDESHLNVGGTLHGGLTATLVDTISTLAIISADSNPGVSVDMNISYVMFVCPIIKSLFHACGSGIANSSTDRYYDAIIYPLNDLSPGLQGKKTS